MKKNVIIGLITSILCFGSLALATPSTQIWIPSTDIQRFGTFHFGLDTYGNLGLKSAANGGRGFNVLNFGLTAGVLPPSISEKVGIEVGLDFRDVSGDTEDPIYGNVKVGVAEDVFGLAIAAGGYDFGTDNDVTDYNVWYGLVSRAFEAIGRFSIGAYTGNDNLLVDEAGAESSSGVLASWDKALSSKWWAAVDFMSGQSSYGALSFGVAYTVGAGSSVILGFDVYNNSDLAKPTVTFQFDHNF